MIPPAPSDGRSSPRTGSGPAGDRAGATRTVVLRFALISAVAAVIAGVLAAPPQQRAVPISAGAHDSRMVEITGRGWGHGRGLGQYGARGYAEAGWTSDRILDHYYGGTTAGPAPADGPVNPEVVRVELRSMRGRSTAVALGEGSILIKTMDHADLATVVAGAARLRWRGDRFVLDTAPACAGPWTAQEVDLGPAATLRFVAQTTVDGREGLLAVCGATTRTWYQGEIRAAVHEGSARTVNTVTVEEYLRGVVPNEMPASWPPAALQAQAVAARSYALAGDRRQLPYADTCDTILCQVYDGAFTERGGFRRSTWPSTDAAIAATAGLVRLSAGGTVARTEFSSSTGGHTAGGDFPAVVDDGDSIAANANHVWSVSVPASTIEARYGRGRLLAAEVTERNGHGADGGRAVRVAFRFERGTVTESAATVRAFLRLRSDWFSFGPVADGSLRSTAEGRWIDWAHTTLAGRPATDGEIADWHQRIQRGDRRALADQLVRGEYFAGRMMDDLYTRALGRPADDAGRAYWVAQLTGGAKLEAIGVLLYGSVEYRQRAGNTDAAFVTALYRDILGREPDAGGRAYWEGRLATGSGLDDVAAGFYVSLESRRVRAEAVHQRIIGPISAPTTRDALADRLLRMGDLALAADIAAAR